MGEWQEYQKLVLSELERLNDEVSKVRSELSEVRTDIATLKVKAGMWGAAAGCLPALAIAALRFVG